MKHALLTLVLFTCAAVALQAQAPPAFEVASLKVAAIPTDGRIMRRCSSPDPAIVRCDNATLKMLLVQAYGVKNFQIQGPSWIDSDGFDLMAKIPDGVSKEQVPAMLQALLAQRFGVTLHKETKTLPVYELTVAKGGPKLKEVDPAKLPQMPSPGMAPPPPPPPGRGGGPPSVGALPAGAVMVMMGSNGSTTTRGNMTIAQLISRISMSLDRPIFDATDLKGTYEIELTYLADETDAMRNGIVVMAGPGPGPGGGAGAEAPRQQDANTPIATLFQAVQQTLGLKLDPKRAQVEMLIIDSANRVPTEN